MTSLDESEFFTSIIDLLVLALIVDWENTSSHCHNDDDDEWAKNLQDV